MRPAVYTMWDSSGTAVYVGQSLDAFRRLAQHKQSARWIDEVANVTIEHVSTPGEAARLERQRIEQLKPVHNTVGLEWANRQTPRCTICQNDIEVESLRDPIKVCQMVQGYEKKRISGGANQISMRRELGIFAHRWCVENHNKDRNQLRMFDVPQLG